MEAKTKIMAAVAVIVMCAAGLVGAGYAYTASTQNAGNSVESEYVVLSQSGTGAYNFVDDQHVYYNTVNTAADTTTYLLGNTTTINGYDVIKLGATFTIEAVQDANTTEADMLCKITFTAGTVHLVDGYVLMFKTVNNNVTEYSVYTAEGTWVNSDNGFNIADNAGASYYDTTVEVFYGYANGSAPSTQPHNTPLEGVTVTFTVEKPGTNTLLVSIAGAAAESLLNTATVTVKCGDKALTVTTQYTVVWRDDWGVLDPTIKTFEAGKTYTVEVTGVGDYVGHSGVGTVSIPAANP